MAIKVLSVNRLDEAHRRRFERETSTTGKLSSHPHIVTLHQAGFTDEGRPYLVMGYLDGGSLGDRLAANGPMSWEEGVRLGVNVSGALATAHAAGIIHRDVKPDNILIDDFGGHVLSDFGIASVTGNDGASMTATGQVTGTIAYSPPEVLDGARPDERTDVFALGATLFALLGGHPPYVETGDTSLAQVLARMMRQDPPDLATYGVPAPVAAVIARALIRDRSRRTPSAIAFGQQLQDAQEAMGLQRTSMILPQTLQAGGVAERTLVIPGLALPSAPAPQDVPTAALGDHPALTPTAALQPQTGQQFQSTAPDGPRPGTQPIGTPAGPAEPPGTVSRRGVIVAGILVGLAIVVVAGVGYVLLTTGGAGPGDAASEGTRQTASDSAIAATPPPLIPPAPPAPVAGPPVVVPPPALPPTALPPTALPPPPPSPPSVPLTNVMVLSAHPDALAIGATLQQWHDGINASDYELAFATYSAQLQQQVTFDRFRDGNQTSVIVDPTVVSVDAVGNIRQVVVAFRSTQDPDFGPDGQACSDWVLQWTVGLNANRWVVDAVAALDGSPTAC